jgi:hypothetical protein
MSRVRDVLADIIAKPQTAGATGALNTLANAAAHVSTREQEAQAQQEGETAARRARSELARSAFEILRENAERLWVKIHSQAANAKRAADSSGSFVCQIGTAQLIISQSASDVLPQGAFSQSGWDVVAYSRVTVMQLQPPYRWSASLWFAKTPGASDYRWLEASYWSWRGSEFEPHAELPGRDADLAASKITHSLSFAFGPVPIDDEHEEAFHDRWIWLLSKAAIGQLRRPSSMPFGWPPY